MLLSICSLLTFPWCYCPFKISFQSICVLRSLCWRILLVNCLKLQCSERRSPNTNWCVTNWLSGIPRWLPLLIGIFWTMKVVLAVLKAIQLLIPFALVDFHYFPIFLHHFCFSQLVCDTKEKMKAHNSSFPLATKMGIQQDVHLYLYEKMVLFAIS